MFRLRDQQLHMLLGLLCGASVLLFYVFGIRHFPGHDKNKLLDKAQDFSEGWICTYHTKNRDKIKEYQNTQKSDIEANRNRITEVVNLPIMISVQEGTNVTLTHKLPAIHSDTTCLALQTNRQTLRVSVGTDVLYSSEESDENIPAYHVIPVPSQYQNMVVTVELQDHGSEQVEIGSVLVGTYQDILIQTFDEGRSFLVTGFILFNISVCLLALWLFIRNTPKKKLLCYVVLEGMFLGILFLAGSRLARAVSGWNYGMYLISSCLVILIAVLHLMIIRSRISRKKVLFLVDLGVLFFVVFYISVMVLQAFSLITFADIYQIGIQIFAISILLYTIVLGVAVYDYKQKAGAAVFFANVFLLLCLAAYICAPVLKIQNVNSSFYIPCGFLVYMVILWLHGLKEALNESPVTEENGSSDAEIRAQVIEQLNPNLLFASFHTLQNLIKSGSENSVKMIYYISVYIRDNLKAISQAGEIIPFEEELEHIIAYLQLQKMRNQKLDFAIECKVKEFRIPRHSIEPIVENAVKYGIANHDNKGNVVFRSYQRTEGYAIQIIDDGVGMNTETLTRNSPTAVLNLFSILETICKAKTEIISKEGKGTVVTIILPMLENDLMEE